LAALQCGDDMANNRPTSASPINLVDLPRNDVDAAIAYVVQELDARGRVDPDDVHCLALLQDDDEALWPRLDGALRDWEKATGRKAQPDE
jgi:hypothetical protein